MDGLLVIDKPVGPTSHDVVARVRRILGEQRVGHTGTLDPGASGVLPLVVGRATRLARFLSAAGKSYDAAIQLGVATDTGDSAGTPVGTRIPRSRSPGASQSIARSTPFAGPSCSSHRPTRRKRLAASAVIGWRAPRARALLPPRPALPAPVRVTVHALELGSVDGGRVTLRVDCSAGFYVRGLAHDLGQRLGVGGHLAALKRVRSGDLTLADAAVLAALELDPPAALAALVPLAQMLPALTALTLTHEGARRTVHGLDLGPADFEGGFLACAVRRRCETVPSARRRRALLSRSPSRSKGPGFCTPRSCWCNILSLFD